MRSSNWNKILVATFFTVTFALLFSMGHLYAEEGGEKKESGDKGRYFVKIGSGYAVTSWEDSPFTVDQKYLAPSLLRLDIGGISGFYEFKNSVGFIRELGVVFSTDQMFHINFKIVTLAAGVEFVLMKGIVTSDDSKLKNTQYYRNSLGMVGRVTLDLLLADLYLEYRQKTPVDTRLAKMEGMETIIGHEYDRFTKLGATISLLGLKALGELTWIKLGNSAVLSKEFSTALPEDDLFRITVGGGLSIGRMELLLKYQRILEIEDEVAYLYQATHLFPDYIMSKNTIFVEAVWKF